jgi:hypothetical protein
MSEIIAEWSVFLVVACPALLLLAWLSADEGDDMT